ncbi:MAG: hypothetical protein ABIO40_11300 [Devosia sp.]
MTSPAIQIRRLPHNPIILPRQLPLFDRCNINGPSLIRAPEWLPDRLGTYYLYFAHHAGRYIRLAVSDDISGPWRVHRPGSLRLADATGCREHIASPDVHVDHEKREIRMYFHGVMAGKSEQASFVANSTDGLNFSASADPIADFYLRVVRWRDQLVGMSKGGRMYLGAPGGQRLEPLLVPAFPMSGRSANGRGDVRHVALRCAGDRLTVYFTRIGDRPESILVAEIDLSKQNAEWLAGTARLVLRPETDWEGAGFALRESRSGAARRPENALRDPAIYEENGRVFLLYSVAGERGIAMAELL